jgi:hypothetical protein
MLVRFGVPLPTAVYAGSFILRLRKAPEKAENASKCPTEMILTVDCNAFGGIVPNWIVKSLILQMKGCVFTA